MSRLFTLFLLSLALTTALSAATMTVVINGKAVPVPMVTVQGKDYIDVAALAQLLNGSATYDAATHKLVFGAPKPAASAGATGTAQLPGENGQLDALYTMGVTRSFYFRLTRAEFTTAPVAIGTTLYSPKAAEKLLVLHFTVQNPSKTDAFIRGDVLKMTAVDAMNVNHEAENVWGDAENHQTLALSLKPAQKIAAYAVIRVPAQGPIPKLMVQATYDLKAPVLRYDLREKVAALQPPIADPADPSGATALETVPAQLNTAYPYKNYTITVEKWETTTEALHEGAPRDGGSFFVATLLVKNLCATEKFLRYDFIQPAFVSTDGEVLRYRGMLFATANRTIAQPMKAGEEMRVRIVFLLPKGATPKSLSLAEGGSRTYTYAVTP